MKYKLKRIYKRNYIFEKALFFLMIALICACFYTQGYYAGQLKEIRNAEVIETEMR